jgi:hypothetical protein
VEIAALQHEFLATAALLETAGRHSKVANNAKLSERPCSAAGPHRSGQMNKRKLLMTRLSFRAASAAALLATVSLTALSISAFAADAPKITRDVGKNLQDAQKADQAKDYKTALEAIQKAQAVSDRTPYDDYMINQFLLQTDVGLNDMQGADTAAEALAAYPDIPDAQKSATYHNALGLALNFKHYDKAMIYAKALQAMPTPPDARASQEIIEAYAYGGDVAGAAALAKKPVDAAVAAGQRPTQQDLNLLFQVQAMAKDEAGAEQTLLLRATSYNDPADWGRLIDTVLGTKGETDLDIIYIGRLLFVCGAPVTPQDATIIGQTASHLTFFGDALNAQQHGGTGFADPSARAAQDKKDMPKEIAAGQKQGGQYNVKLAEALYSYGMYPEAEAAARLAQQKGGATDPTEAPMVIGMAQVAQNKYADAATTFATVTSGSPATPRIAALWAAFAKMKANPPPATATAQQ